MKTVIFLVLFPLGIPLLALVPPLCLKTRKTTAVSVKVLLCAVPVCLLAVNLHTTGILPDRRSAVSCQTSDSRPHHVYFRTGERYLSTLPVGIQSLNTVFLMWRMDTFTF